MKIALYITIFLLAIISCKNDKETVDPASLQDVQIALSRAQSVCNQNSMVWLSEMLRKAEEDRVGMTHKGNYIGIISLINYRGQPAIYTNFGLGSGGVAYYLFDCNGNSICCESGSEAFKLPDLATNKKNIIYTSLIY